MSKKIRLGVMFGGILSIILAQSIAFAYENGIQPVTYNNPTTIELVPALVRAENSVERVTRKIHDAFPEEPIMVRVAWCESRLDPHAVGRSDGRDHGLFQIRDIHDTTGYDVFNEDDNIAFARILYEQSGLKPWFASIDCWSKG